LHHLRPADASVNSSKSDKDLDDGAVTIKRLLETDPTETHGNLEMK